MLDVPLIRLAILVAATAAAANMTTSTEKRMGNRSNENRHQISCAILAIEAKRSEQETDAHTRKKKSKTK